MEQGSSYTVTTFWCWATAKDYTGDRWPFTECIRAETARRFRVRRTWRPRNPFSESLDQSGKAQRSTSSFLRTGQETCRSFDPRIGSGNSKRSGHTRREEVGGPADAGIQKSNPRKRPRKDIPVMCDASGIPIARPPWHFTHSERPRAGNGQPYWGQVERS